MLQENSTSTSNNVSPKQETLTQLKQYPLESKQVEKEDDSEYKYSDFEEESVEDMYKQKLPLIPEGEYSVTVEESEIKQVPQIQSKKDE